MRGAIEARAASRASGPAVAGRSTTLACPWPAAGAQPPRKARRSPRGAATLWAAQRASTSTLKMASGPLQTHALEAISGRL